MTVEATAIEAHAPDRVNSYLVVDGDGWLASWCTRRGWAGCGTTRSAPRCSTSPGSPRIIHVPGHTPGSVAVHVPAVDALFLGDTMTTRNVLTGATGPKPAPFTLEPEQAVASLGRIDQVDATWVLPGLGRRRH